MRTYSWDLTAKSDPNRYGALAVLTTMQGKFGEAEALYERCQAVEEKVLGPDHPSFAATILNRAGSLKAQVRTDRGSK